MTIDRNDAKQMEMNATENVFRLPIYDLDG